MNEMYLMLIYKDYLKIVSICEKLLTLLCFNMTMLPCTKPGTQIQ